MPSASSLSLRSTLTTDKQAPAGRVAAGDATRPRDRVQ